MLGNFTGTFRLVKLALRRDRIKLSIWIIFITVLNISMLPALNSTYGSPDQRAIYAESMSTSVIGRMFGGVLDSSSMGAILMIEAFLFMSILIAFMSAQVIVRHTRFNEELGSAELIQSCRVGRFAMLNTSLIVALIANFIIVIISSFAMQGNENITPSGAWLYNIALGLVGMSFASIAALISQLSKSTKTTSLMIGCAIGGSAIIRGIGDSFANTDTSGVVNSMWLSWLSPIGWGQQIYPFTRQQDWIIWIFVIFILLITIFAYVILNFRDVGSGLFPQKLGLSRARRYLLSIVGLTWRLNRTTLFAWTAILMVLAVTTGAMIEQFKELLISSDVMRQYLAYAGSGSDGMVKEYQRAMIAVSMILAVAFVVQVLQRLRSEESDGYLEQILATNVSRGKWLFAHILFSLLGVTIICTVFGVMLGLSIKMVSGVDWNVIPDMIRYSLAYLPAIGIYIGIMVAIFGIIPSMTSIVAWGSFLLTLVISQLGNLFKFPKWIMNISPFEHIPGGPVESITVRPLLTMSIVGILLIILGATMFMRRNIKSQSSS